MDEKDSEDGREIPHYFQTYMENDVKENAE
jgi:hypothetical protein